MLFLRRLLLQLAHRRPRTPTPTQLRSLRRLRLPLRLFAGSRGTRPLAPRGDGIQEFAAELLGDAVVRRLIIVDGRVGVRLVVDLHCAARTSAYGPLLRHPE